MADADDATAPVAELRLHRVLVALDHSESAELALSAATTVALRDAAVLTLLTVVPNVAAQGSAWIAGGGVDPLVLQEDADAEAQQLLRHAVDRIPEEVSVTTILRRGKAGPEIVAQAKGGTYDAIFIGARGRGRVGALLGSVSGYVLHHAPTAVFVAHAPGATTG